MIHAVEFSNEARLLDDARSAARRVALEVAGSGLDILNPETATRRVMARQGSELVVDGRTHSLLDRRVFLVGAGKASLPIARAATQILGDDLTAGLVVVPKGTATALGDRIDVLQSDHPIPSERSVASGESLLAFAARVHPGDLVICCFTGGSSALASVPAADVTMSEKRSVNEILLASGLDIVQTNTVRKHLSQLKGGRLADAMRGATIVNLTVPDVAGNHLDAITDPTVQDTTTPDQAIEVLQRSGLWSEIPKSVRLHLKKAPRPPDLSSVDIQTVFVTTGEDACEAMIHTANALGYKGVATSTDWTGEASENGARAAKLALDSVQGTTGGTKLVLVACGGESTVDLGSWNYAGLGGPNQEFCLAAAQVLAGHPDVAVIAIDTDGNDGSTQWAGGLIDGTTAARIGRDRLRAALKDHSSSRALEASGDLVSTGATGTNVNDLYVIVIGHPDSSV